ncbi:hypothetical protein V2G26_003091 [Clonostachys chloroleuca]
MKALPADPVLGQPAPPGSCLKTFVRDNPLPRQPRDRPVWTIPPPPLPKLAYVNLVFQCRFGFFFLNDLIAN